MAEEDPQKEQPNYERLANRYLSQSRKGLDIRNRSAEEQASYYLSAAQVYAILELAQAMRDSRLG
jgi:hypothetical protein